MLTAGLMIPLAGTSLGAAAVFLMKSRVNETLQNILLAFASGVMLAASVWSLLLPAVETSSGGRLRFIPAAAGLLFGIAFLAVLDIAAERFFDVRKESSAHRKTVMMVFAVTLHNIPEGMAVGVALAAAISKESEITMAAALALSVGIAIQNFPEGAIISMPLKSDGAPKGRAFLLGVLSGAVEPVFGFLTLLVTKAITAVLPYLLSFAAGCMIFVVVSELIPDSQSGRFPRLSTAVLAVGFVSMMALDVCFG